MDPRVKTSLAGLLKKLQVETKLAELMSQSSQAVLQGNSIREQLESIGKQEGAPKGEIAAFQEKLSAVLGAAGGFFAPPSPEVTLSRVNGQASALYQQVWQSDAEPTASQMEAMAATEHENAGVMKRWNEFQKTDLPAFNGVLRGSKLPEIHMQADTHQEETQVDEE